MTGYDIIIEGQLLFSISEIMLLSKFFPLSGECLGEAERRSIIGILDFKTILFGERRMRSKLNFNDRRTERFNRMKVNALQ